jgi:hypothetical protein
VPHHSFHVFGVYPWVGLLGSDRGETPLHVLDRGLRLNFRPL